LLNQPSAPRSPLRSARTVATRCSGLWLLPLSLFRWNTSRRYGTARLFPFLMRAVCFVSSSRHTSVALHGKRRCPCPSRPPPLRLCLFFFTLLSLATPLPPPRLSTSERRRFLRCLAGGGRPIHPGRLHTVPTAGEQCRAPRGRQPLSKIQRRLFMSPTPGFRLRRYTSLGGGFLFGLLAGAVLAWSGPHRKFVLPLGARSLDRACRRKADAGIILRWLRSPSTDVSLSLFML